MAQKTKAKASRRSAAKKGTKATPRKPQASSSAAKQQFLDTFTREHAITKKVLRALPPEQSEFRPHPRSKNARELAWMFVGEQGLITKTLTDQLTFGAGGPPPAPGDFQDILTQYEKDFENVVDLIKKTPESKLSATVRFPTGPGQMSDWPKMALLWFMLSDQIHHRGQFSLYVRMAGGKVPSIYGPSADEPWR
jgi:uncharacterized damage-inducible protein DinB